ncbi:hypothetical protein MLD38_006489 [Melastoma candidum]|uniref:Uncharacterized protein n=1 Tax=Melastoma candidum TaxID=119954 RepID=A0ACB9RP90_9MYRT|nr:hypothetical protein MLD38_006489 [Melastoma candidum]
MLTVYVLETPTKGRVVLETTHGPLDIELWPKEAPKAVRNFVQLCLEGYYDNTIFHRIIKDFLVQGEDPTGTGTGTGGESVYGSTFVDEFHSRLHFKHRGLVACANEGRPHSNGSQFFITLDSCDWLDKKHTIFTKGDRLLDPPPKNISVEVLWNPFDDIIPRTPERPRIQSTLEPEKKTVTQKPMRRRGEEKELKALNQKIRSSHDMLDDPRLLKEDVASKDLELEML